MNYILKNHDYTDDIVVTIMMFYPNEKYAQITEPEGRTVLSAIENGGAFAAFYDGGECLARAQVNIDPENEKNVRFGLRTAVFKCLMQVHPIKAPWGTLTGVRPAKLVQMMYRDGLSDEEVYASLKNDYFVTDEKIRLAMKVAKSEQRIVENGIGKIGLYIGIPFCPTRCLYCSFTSYPLDKYANKVDLYLDALEREIKFTAELIKDKELESIYIGGGTPTSLNETQLERLLTLVSDSFKTPVEYTVEAGRPDTIDIDKLRIIKDHNVGRISINPQTLNDETLVAIGRRHTVEDFYKAFKLARQAGHDHINTDIILGLPGEDETHVTKTMDGLERLSPESITVHTLAVKRASRLKETLEQYELTDFDRMEKMLAVTSKRTAEMGLQPYYMYRQKNMVGNFENVGYCKPNCECIYNVQIMEEQQSIIALGAGGSTKTVEKAPDGDKIERIFNVKSVDDYINRIDEMIMRKKTGLENF
ncbi:MAG: coproporphyrinogen dehydrogenase HemZ [Firmicutes bacterium]|nr:coproporphyrinogen dehydrogenase HemZ [Bacillota bacterium]